MLVNVNDINKKSEVNSAYLIYNELLKDAKKDNVVSFKNPNLCITHHLDGDYCYCVIVNHSEDIQKINMQIADGYTYYLLEADGNIVGYTGVCPGDGYLFLSKLYIRKEERGRGFASKALALVKETAKEQGFSRIRLTVNKGNANSIAVYKNWGFETVDSVVTDIGEGFVMDDYVMELVLNT